MSGSAALSLYYLPLTHHAPAVAPCVLLCLVLPWYNSINMASLQRCTAASAVHSQQLA